MGKALSHEQSSLRLSVHRFRNLWRLKALEQNPNDGEHDKGVCRRRRVHDQRAGPL